MRLCIISNVLSQSLAEEMILNSQLDRPHCWRGTAFPSYTALALIVIYLIERGHAFTQFGKGRKTHCGTA